MSSTQGSSDAGSDRTTQATHEARAGTLEGRKAALALLAAAQFMSVLDASIITVALPTIQSDLSLSMSALSWVVNAYVLAFGGLLLLGGRVGDLLGRRRIFMFGIALFVKEKPLRTTSVLGGASRRDEPAAGPSVAPVD